MSAWLHSELCVSDRTVLTGLGQSDRRVCLPVEHHQASPRGISPSTVGCVSTYDHTGLFCYQVTWVYESSWHQPLSHHLLDGGLCCQTFWFPAERTFGCYALYHVIHCICEFSNLVPTWVRCSTSTTLCVCTLPPTFLSQACSMTSYIAS